MILALSAKGKQKSEALKNNEIRLEVPTSDFIPYACHYNKDTILTKNGELLQTIEIRVFSNKKISSAIADVRQKIRNAVLETIKSTQFALYFHTIRHAMNLDVSSKFPSYFTQKMHQSWVRANSWDKKHVNNLYITIIRGGIKLDFSTFLKSPSINSIVKQHDESLIEAMKELEFVTSNIIKKLDVFEPIKLGMIKDNATGYYSNLLKFFSKIIHVQESTFPVEIRDLSRSLAVNKVAFGYNALEIKKANKKLFATIFSVKGNTEINPTALGKFLQMPQQMVITQAVNFIDTKKGRKDTEHQSYILNVSKDSEFRDKSGLHEVEQVDLEAQNIFCNVQSTIMVIADNLEQLKHESLQTYKILGELGLPAVKEDLNMEHCFWSQLPANFVYAVRQSTSLSAKIAHFTLLNNLPFGKLKSKWGRPITLFETALDSPYFFNFHVEDNGHTIIIGDDNSGKSVMVNFLLSESLKFNTKFIYLDSYKRSALYMKALGVEYKVFSFDVNVNQLKMNPLRLEDTQDNRVFLQHWFIFLLNTYTNASTIKIYLPVISKAIDVLFSLPVEKRKISNIAKFFIDKNTAKINKEIISKLQQWIGKGQLAHIFDNDSDYLINTNGANIAIDIADIYDTSMAFNLPILTYILHFFKEYFTGKTPSIFCVTEGSRVFNSMYFELNLEYILDELKKRNAIALIHASFCSEEVNWSEKVAKIYSKKIDTQIFMANSATSYNNIIKLFNVNQQEQMYLQSLDAGTRQFLLRQNNVSIVLTLDLSRCEKELGILAGDTKYVECVNNLIKEHGEDPSIWLPVLYNN